MRVYYIPAAERRYFSQIFEDKINLNLRDFNLCKSAGINILIGFILLLVYC